MTGSWSWSESTRTEPDSAERLITRTKPCLPDGSDAVGNSGTTWLPVPSAISGAVDRLEISPLGLANRLTNVTGPSARTDNCHFPVPSPSEPSNPAPPASSSAAVRVRATPAGISISTPSPAVIPRSSVPVIVALATSSPELTRRNELTWLALAPGLKNATRYESPSLRATVSCTAVRNPPAVRM